VPRRLVQKGHVSIDSQNALAAVVSTKQIKKGGGRELRLHAAEYSTLVCFLIGRRDELPNPAQFTEGFLGKPQSPEALILSFSLQLVELLVETACRYCYRVQELKQPEDLLDWQALS